MTIIGILRNDEEFVIALAKKFSGTWRPGEKNKTPDAYLSIGAREIAVEFLGSTQHITDDRGTWPRLSDDMPAIKLANELDAELNTLVPDGQTIVVALNAPMLKVRKTTDALRKMLREMT